MNILPSSSGGVWECGMEVWCGSVVWECGVGVLEYGVLECGSESVEVWEWWGAPQTGVQL